MLKQKGFNPMIGLYQYRANMNTDDALIAWRNRFGQIISKFETDFWFCITESKCDYVCPSNCNHAAKRFIYNGGNRLIKSTELGRGGFGTVYASHIHGMDIAAKYIDITDKYRSLITKYTSQFGFVISEVITYLLGELAFEATIQSGFGHPNILTARDYWIQCSNLNKTELVIATRKCYKNLQIWLKTEQFNFHEIRKFMIEVTKGLEYLKDSGLSHRDIKPANILITEKRNPRAVITDFGLVKADGVTPVYCAPERFVKNGTIPEKTDVYSLGITILNCFCDPAITLLALFGTLEKAHQSLVDQIQADEILKLVQIMIDYDTSRRPTLLEVRNKLMAISPISSRKTSQDFTTTFPAQDLPGQQTMQLSYGMESVFITQKTLQFSTQVHQSIISGSIHDQKESGLCWAFATSTVIRAELKRLIIRLERAGAINPQLADQALKITDQINKENRLMFELVCLINPRSPKMEDFFGNRETLQKARSGRVMRRICFDGFLRPAGWTRLPTVRRITDLLNTSSFISKIEFKPKDYAHPLSNLNFPKITTAIQDTVSSEGKPAVAIINGCHAVTLTKEENGNYIFKNSYGANNARNPGRDPWIQIPTSRQPGSTRNDFKIFL